MSGDVSKLPRWAQHHIARLEADLASLEQRARSRDAGQTAVEVVELAQRGMSWHLDDHAIVRWTLPYDARDGRPATVEVRLSTDGQFRVSSSGGALILRPHVTNVVYVDVERTP